MSGFQVYELEDIVWDDFSESDDHIVPHPDGEHGNEHLIQGDNCKRPRCEVIGLNNNVNDRTATKYVRQGEEETSLPTLIHKRDKMLEKGSWSCTADGVSSVFPASCDGDLTKEATSLSSDDTMMSTRCFKNGNIESVDEFCTNDPILGDRCVAADSNIFRYPLSHSSQEDNPLSFFDNAQDEKECGDLLYGWPDIGNFEDVDRMFRSCDSTFGLGNAGNEEELSWFSSSHTNEESEDALKLRFKFPPESSVLKSVSEQNEASRPNEGNPSITESTKKTISIGCKPGSQVSEANKQDVLSHLSFMDGSETVTEGKDDFTPKEHVYLHKKPSKHQNLSDGKRKDRYTENGDGIHHFPNPKQFADVKLPLRDSSYQVLSNSGIRKQDQSVGSNSLSYSHIPYTHSNYNHHSSERFPVSPNRSCVKSENNGHSPFSHKESSYASNIQSMESSHDASFEASAINVDEKREKLYRRQGVQTSLTVSSKHKEVVQAACYDPISMLKQLNYSENEGQSEVEGGSVLIPTDMDSSNAQDSSCMSSLLDEISLEATSFRQLQNVMEQLDIRTKLCIRDSLYRLARSAEQRHNCGSLNSSSGDDRDTSGLLMAAEPNKCTGYMDMETDTNPIDRSIAHLLFHRPSDTSIMPNDSISVKSQNMMQGSITSPSAVAEKLVSLEENAAGLDKNVADLDKK